MRRDTAWTATVMLLGGVGLPTGSARAVVENYVMTIDNVQEQAAGNCLAGSTAIGSGTATLDTGTLLFSWNLTFGNNSPDFNNGTLDQGAETAAHFHKGAPGVSGGIAHGVGTGNPKVGSTTVTGAEATDIQAGLWYINIHSSGCTSGEIRGQVVDAPAVPALSPAAVGPLLAAALAGAGWLAVRRRRVGKR